MAKVTSAASKTVLAAYNNYKKSVNAKTAAAQTQPKTPKAISTKINIVQTALSNRNVSDALKRAQQALSEKYGIPTFDPQGFISTVPTTRPIDTSINVGTGALTQSAFSESVRILTEQAQIPTASSGGGIVDFIGKSINDFFDSVFKTTPENLPDEIKAKLADIDNEILVNNRAIQGISEKYSDALNRFNNAKSVDMYQDTLRIIASESAQYNTAISRLLKQKDDILLKYKIDTEINSKISQMIADLEALRTIPNMTAEIKAQIKEKLSESSALIERILLENLDVSKDLLKSLQSKMSVLAEKYNEQITVIHDDMKNNIDVGKELLEFFGGVSKTISDLAFDFVDSFKAQKQAIAILRAEGQIGDVE